MNLDGLISERVAELVDQRLNERLAEYRNEQAAGNLPEVMTTQEVADAFGRTVQHINTLARTGALRSKKDGRGRLFLREWVLDYLRSDRSAPAMSRADRARLRNRNIPAPSGARAAQREGPQVATASRSF